MKSVLAQRWTTQGIVVNGAADQYVVFGPFRTGERVVGLWIHGSDAVPSTGFHFNGQVGVGAEPGDTAAKFARLRMLTDNLYFQIGQGAFFVPLAWEASDLERFLTYDFINSTGSVLTGFVGLVLGDSAHAIGR